MAKKKINSLDELKKIKFKKPSKDTLPYKLPPKPESKAEDDSTLLGSSETELFFSAMRGVEQLEKNSGRQVEARPEPQSVAPPENPDKLAKKQLNDLVNGNIEFELEYSEEYMYGFVRGIDSRIFQKLKNGGFSREAHLDLHGMNTDQALESLLFFLRESYLQGKRCILLVTGRGTGSPGGQSVLKRAVQGWLTKDPLRRMVLAFATAQLKDGGAGALYVLLRNKRKDVGKVQWDRSDFIE